MRLDSNEPSGPIEQRWDKRLFDMKLVNPANKRKYEIIVVGTGLAGASAAASLGEMGYHVDAFFYQDSARRAHSVAAQGGINAAKNYRNDGDSIFRLFYDTIKGGDYRSREANVYRLAQVSNNIIDQCVAQGVPFAREYGGMLDNRSFGGAQVSRTFYARGQTGQQLLLGAYQALARQVHAGTVTLHSRHEMLDLVLVDEEFDDESARRVHRKPAAQRARWILLTSPSRLGRPDTVYQEQINKPLKWRHFLRVLCGAPARGPDRPQPLVAKEQSKLADLIPLRSLLAEDNRVNQKLALAILRKFGYTADVATNGQEAIAAVERRSYDLVLMDVLMPVLDGLEATRRIRARDKGKQPVILAMTANVLETDQQVCLQAGMDDYLSKPVTTAAVRAKLIELFGQEEQAG